ncbi:MAG TPA: heavy metal-associated domain-containing protein [Nocardioides sp.]|nr:heavy metal-associated domain-containing protein [Nocardioides sp.]
MTSATERYIVPGMVCRNCADTVTEALTALDGVREVLVDLDAGEIAIEATTHVAPETVQRALDAVGYAATPNPSPQPDPS